MMAGVAVDLLVELIIRVGLFFLPQRPERLSRRPWLSPAAPFPLSLETAERMIEEAYDRSPSRRVSGGERHHPPSREDVD
jgi:hypothetical protein